MTPKGEVMAYIIKGLIVLAVVAFVLAVLGTGWGLVPRAGVSPEGYSRACSNLALIAIADGTRLGGCRDKVYRNGDFRCPPRFAHFPQ